MRRQRFVIIPTNGRECLDRCLAAIRPQVDMVVLIKTKEFVRHGHHPDPGLVSFQDYDGVNISRWWNDGLFAAAEAVVKQDPGPTKWDVAIINDDVIVPEGWFDAISGSMRQLRAAAGCSGGTGRMPVLHTQPGPVPLDTRLQGFAFIVAGEFGLRANEELRWYWSDDYMDWESRKLGGMVMIPDFHVEHLYPNQQVTAEMQVMIAEDGQKFVDLYGMRPW